MAEDDPKHINAKVLISLIRKKTESATRIGEINGELGEKLKHHQDHSNLNRSAFGFVAKLHRMEEMKREAAIDALQLYIDIAREGLWGMDQHVGDLVKDAEADPNAKAAEANTDALKVGIKPLKRNRGAKNGKPDEAALDDLTNSASGDDFETKDVRPGFLQTGGVAPAQA